MNISLKDATIDLLIKFGIGVLLIAVVLDVATWIR